MKILVTWSLVRISDLMNKIANLICSFTSKGPSEGMICLGFLKKCDWTENRLNKIFGWEAAKVWKNSLQFRCSELWSSFKRGPGVWIVAKWNLLFSKVSCTPSNCLSVCWLAKIRLGHKNWRDSQDVNRILGGGRVVPIGPK